MKLKLIPFFRLFFVITLVAQFIGIDANATTDFPVLIRGENFKPTIIMQPIDSLTNNYHFDGPHFKIVIGESEYPISFDCDPETLLRASTVYYHLEKARQYFINTIHSKYVENLEKMTIRINITRSYNSLGHYSHINTPSIYNDALSIMDSPGYPSKGVGPWGKEIWFRPARETELSEFGNGDDLDIPLNVQLRGFRESTHLSTVQKIILDMSQKNLILSEINTTDAVEYLLASAMLEIAIIGIAPLTKALTRNKYWLDSAMVPEIIYHEYSHQALTDSLQTTHSGPVIEGMADYFAGKISNSPVLAGKINKYNSFTKKQAKRKNRKYAMAYESNEMAHDDFVFALLWGVQDIIGPQKSLELIYDARTKLTSHGKIRNDLTQALLDSCSSICKNPNIDRYKLLEYFNSWGI